MIVTLGRGTELSGSSLRLSLRQRIQAELSGVDGPLRMLLLPVAGRQTLFSSSSQAGFDALLTTAEGDRPGRC
ncbi:MAG: hypothetical protein WAM11_05700 [Cyanobium sp.]